MIDEILKKIEWNGAEWTPIESSIEEALTAIYEIGLGVIGDFEDVKAINGKNTQLRGQGRNDLRGQFRKAWAKACGVADV